MLDWLAPVQGVAPSSGDDLSLRTYDGYSPSSGLMVPALEETPPPWQGRQGGGGGRERKEAPPCRRNPRVPGPCIARPCQQVSAALSRTPPRCSRGLAFVTGSLTSRPDSVTTTSTSASALVVIASPCPAPTPAASAPWPSCVSAVPDAVGRVCRWPGSIMLMRTTALTSSLAVSSTKAL